MSRGARSTFPPTIATVAGSLAALVGAFLPWLRTGEARRSAFGLARSADALGFIDTPLRRTLVILWYLVPLATAAVWTAAALKQPGFVVATGMLVGSLSVAAAWVYLSLARPGEPGPVVALTAGLVTVASSGWLAWSAKSRPAAAKPMEGVGHER